MIVPDPKPENIYYGHFATMSRLITTLVSEDMIPAYFIPFNDAENDGTNVRTIAGFCVAFNIPADSTRFTVNKVESIYTVAVLRGVPELVTGQSITIRDVEYRKISLIHPWDIMPYVYGPSTRDLSFDLPDAIDLDSSFLQDADYYNTRVLELMNTLGLPDTDKDQLKSGYDSIRLWRRYAYNSNIPARVADMCAFWFKNSSEFQTHIYDHPNPLPSIQSNPIHWEHCVMEGHPLFSISRTVRAIHPCHPLYPKDYGKLLQHTKVRLAAIPRDSMDLNGHFENETHVLVNAILDANGNAQDLRARYANHVLLPIHELQVPNIQEKVANAIVLPEQNHVEAYGLSSIRTVAVPGIVDGHTIKLALGIELASIQRTLPPASARYGYRFSTEIAPELSYDRSVLYIQKEPASASYRHEDPEIAKHCCCIVRQSIEIRTTSTNDGFAVCASLVEKVQRPDTTETLVTNAWGLDTEEKRATFLDSYIGLFFRAIIPPCRDNGVAFEFHAQNSILRYDRINGNLKGFMIRDLCDMQVHYETLKRTCDVRVEDLFPEGGYTRAASLEQVYIFLYYGAIYVHLQTLVRVLGMHHNGRGWAMARKHFTALVPETHPMYDFFMRSEQVYIRSYTRTRLGNGSINNAFFERLLKPNLLLTGRTREEPATSQASSSQAATPQEVSAPQPSSSQASSSKATGARKIGTRRSGTRRTSARASSSRSTTSSTTNVEE